jgi:hypothetical protein
MCCTKQRNKREGWGEGKPMSHSARISKFGIAAKEVGIGQSKIPPNFGHYVLKS